MNQQEKLDQVLNEGMDRLFNGESIDRILADYPDLAAELEPLLRTVQNSRALARVQPRTEFKSRARYEFMTAIREKETRSKRRFTFNWRWQSPWAIALASILVVVLAGGGTLFASGYSMPGEALYAVKLTAEKAQLAVTFSDVTRAELNAKYAERRIAEIEYLATQGNADQIQIAAANLNYNLNNMSRISLGDYEATMSDEPPTANALMFNTESASVPGEEVSASSETTAQTTEAVTGGGAATFEADQASPELMRKAVVPDQSTETPVTPMAAPAAQPAVSAMEQAPSPDDVSTTLTPHIMVLNEPEPQIYTTAQDEDGSSPELTEKERIRRIIEENYQERQARLLAVLENAKPELRQAIKQAIAASEFEYWKAIRNLEMNPDP